MFNSVHLALPGSKARGEDDPVTISNPDFSQAITVR